MEFGGESTLGEDAIARFVLKLENAGLRGMPAEEWMIEKAERDLGVDLPIAYKAFLIVAGQGCEPLEGSHYALDDDFAALQLNGKQIAKRGNLELPSDAFVFLTHQGYACQFFLLNDGDDPSVYECVRGMGPIRRVASTFTEWLLQQIVQYRELRQRRANET